MPRSKSIVLIAVAGSTLSAATVAAVPVGTHYDASACRGTSDEDAAKLGHSGATIFTDALGGADVVCPIIKKTSGPGIFNDSLNAVQVSGFSRPSHSSSVQCWLTEYHQRVNPWNPPPSGTNAFSQSENTGSGSTGASFNFSLGVSGIYGYWDGYWGSDSYLYAEITCHLNQFSGLTGYQVDENGSDQTGYRIVSAANCTPTANFHSVLGVPPTSSDGVWGGYLEQDDGTGWTATCPMPPGAGAYVQISVGPAIGDNWLGCRRTDDLWWKWAYGEEYELNDLLFYTGPLICAMWDDAPNGDGRVYSYRTGQSETF
jgi:hypothetical protein